MKNRKNILLSHRKTGPFIEKGYQDQQRHMDKVKEAIQNNLPDLISEESIILSNGRDVIKIPIRSLDEYKIRYNYDNSKHVGQGKGDSQVGMLLRRMVSKGKSGARARKTSWGSSRGKIIMKQKFRLLKLKNALFKEMELPNLEQKEQAEITTEKIEFNDIRKKGLMGNIDKKRTILTAIKRNAMKGKAEITPIHNDDLRFKTWDEVMKPESKAVVLAMMDTSGSMGTF